MQLTKEKLTYLLFLYDYKDKGEFGGILRLEAGQTYYINIYPYSGNVSWRISCTEQTDEYLYRALTDGTVQILKYLGDADSIEIPEYIDGKEVTSIGPGAFYEYDDLRELIIPDSVSSIKAEAFFGCGGLESIELGLGLKEIRPLPRPFRIPKGHLGPRAKAQGCDV